MFEKQSKQFTIQYKMKKLKILVMIHLTLSLLVSILRGQTLYKCPSSSPDCTTSVSLTTTTDCSRGDGYISISSGANLNSETMTQTSWTCPPTQTIAGASYESDEFKLCGFQHSTESATGDAFDGFKAIFCHKYQWTNQKVETIFDDARGGNAPGIVNAEVIGDTEDDPNLIPFYNGQADCDTDDHCFTGLKCCQRHNGIENGQQIQSCIGIQIQSDAHHSADFCICPNWPICPYGHADGNRVSRFQNSQVMCDSGQFIDSIQFDTTTFTSIKFNCSNVATSSSEQVASRSGFKTVGVVDSSNSPDVYTSPDSHFCGVRAVYGALSSTAAPTTFAGLLSLDLILCQSYNCKDSLALTSNELEDRVYKVVPGNTDFEKPAIESISQQSVKYNQTFDVSANPISHYMTNSDNQNCPIKSCQLMENCNVNPSPKSTDSTLIWQPTNQEIQDLASQSSADWASKAASIHIYHVNTDPTSLFKFTELCIQCKNEDRYGYTDKTITTNAFTVEIHCKEGIDVSMADLTNGTKSESSLINSVNQTQHVSADLSLRPKFNFTSFYTTTKACPIDFYQISDDFYIEGATNLVAQSYYRFPAGIVPKSFIDSDEQQYSSQSGPIDIDEQPSPTMSGMVSNNSLFIEVLDGKTPFTYSFKIKAWVLGGYFSDNPIFNQQYNEGQSSFVTQQLTLRAICPTFSGNMDELEPMVSLPDHSTWVGAPNSQSIFSLNQPFRPKLTKCMDIIEYSAVDESASGVLTYPSSSCMTIPCMSWDISTSVVYPVHSPFTFKVQAKSNLGFTYNSSQISIKVLADNSAQPQIQTGLIPLQGHTYILNVGVSQLFEIDQFTEIIYSSYIANYILTTDTTQLSQNLNSPGCGGFLDQNIQGVPQPNGKIGFTISTVQVAPACPVKVYAEVQGNTQIFAFTEVFSISIQCGLETISLHSSIPQPDEIVYSLEQMTSLKLFSITSHQVTGTPIFISSQPSQCDIDHNKYSRVDSSGCSPLAGSQVTLDGTNLKFDADSIFSETICIKAETAKVINSPTLYRLEITVCGIQTLKPTSIPDSQKYHLINQDEPKVVNFANSWFEKVYSSSKPSCVQTISYELKVGPNCQGLANPSDFVLNTLALTITLTGQSSMQSQILCLVASAQGKMAIQYLNVEVCGDEQILYQKFSNYSELHIFERSNDSSDSVQLINLNNLSMNFDSSRVNCPISYRLIDQNNVIWTSLSINQSSGDLSINTFNPQEFDGFIQAYSHNERATYNSDRIRIHVCGSESIDFLNEEFHFGNYTANFVKGNGIKSTRIQLDLFNDGLSDPLCPFKSFDLVQKVDEYSKELEEPYKSDFTWRENTIYVNTNLNLQFYTKNGHKFDDQRKVSFEFYIEGTTRGLVKERREIIVILAEQFLSFNGQEIKLKINVCNDMNCADGWQQITLFEPLIDPTAPKEYFDLLNEITLPSTSFDQPSGQSTDDPSGICFVNIVISQTKQAAYTAKFIQENPGNFLPLNDLMNAIIKYVSYNIMGTNMNSTECSYKVKSLADYNYDNEIAEKMFEDLNQEQLVDEIYDFSQSLQNFYLEELQAQTYQTLKQDEKLVEVKRMRIKSIKIFYNELNNLFLDVNFDMKIMPLNDFLINQLPNFITLDVQSAIDQSKFRGMWVPKKHGRFLSQNETTNGSKEVLNYKESKYFVSQSFESLQFYWRLHNQQEKRLRFKIDFQYPYNVSTNNFGLDTIQLLINENEILKDLDNGNPLDISQYGQYISTDLKPMRAEPNVEQQIKSSVYTISLVILALQASSIYQNLILSKGFQDIWGMISTQIIVIHMTLFKCQQTTPPIIFTFNSYLSQLAQKDMYPTDEIYGAIFDFKDEDSPVELFEFLGYEGVIFISLSGSIIINLLIPTVIWLLTKINKRLVRRFPSVKIFSSVGVQMGVPDIPKTITNIYMASFLELVLCSAISIIGQKNAGFEKGKPSNILSALFMVISVFIMSLIMFVNCFTVCKYKKQLQDTLIKVKYNFIYDGYKKDKIATAIFQVVFMIRRIIFVMIIILLKEFSGVQIISNVALTLVYIIYLAHFKPYEDHEQNQNEIFDDVCTILVSYFLMWLSIFPDYTEEDQDTVSTISWFYVCTASFNLVVNILKLSFQCTIDLPKKWKQLKKQYQDWKYETWKKSFLKKQLQNLKEKPDSKLFKHFANEAQKIQMKEKYEAELKELKVKHQKEIEWVLKINIDDQRYQKFIEESQRAESHELQKKYFGILKKELAQMKMLNVKLEICDMIPISMPHNDRNHILKKNLFPYKEHVYLQKQQEVLKDGKVPSEEEARNFNRNIYGLKQLHLLNYLHYQKYYCVHIGKDGNSGPRAISVLKYGNQDHWRTIRDQVCQKMESDLIKKYKGKEHKKQLKEEQKKIELMKNGKKDCKQFTETELQVCSDLYNMTIVVFSLYSKMRFMDILFKPSKKSSLPFVPLYLLHHENHFTVLAHRSQPQLMKFFRKKGSQVKRFDPNDFMVQFDDLIASLKQSIFFESQRKIDAEKEKNGEMEEYGEMRNIQKDQKNKNEKRDKKQKKTKQSLSRQGKNEKLTKSALIEDLDRISEKNEEDTPSQRSEVNHTKDQKANKESKISVEKEELKVGDSIFPEFEEGDQVLSQRLQSTHHQPFGQIAQEQERALDWATSRFMNETYKETDGFKIVKSSKKLMSIPEYQQSNETRR